MKNKMLFWKFWKCRKKLWGAEFKSHEGNAH